jgi:3-methylcrotonyl-CoA carboxylase alpha subunit
VRFSDIEIQIFGDSHGNVIHLFERDCSVQRRYQKIIEETPSPVLNDSLRNAIAEAAVTIGKAINYRGAGTVEFIFDQKEKKFFFLEVNTRLQVEHPITECITGLDLVELQLRVEEGFSLAELGVTQSSVTRTGHAIECRLYCEDPTTEQFLPSVGLLEWFKLPHAIPGARYDTGVRSGSEISMFYDPMVGKIICHAPDRSSAISKMIRILSEMVVYGPSLKTNQQFLIDLLRHPLFAQGIYTTHLIKDHIPLDSRLQLAKEQRQRNNAERVSAVVSTLLLWHLRRQGQTLLKHVRPGYHNNPPAVASRRPFQLLSMSDHELPVRVDYTCSLPSSTIHFKFHSNSETT